MPYVTQPSTAASPETSRRWEPGRLLARHKTIMEAVLAGKSYADIAREVDCTPNAISMVANSPLFQDQLARMRRERDSTNEAVRASTVVRAQATLEASANQAATTQVELLEAEDPKVRLASANAILDRVMAKESGNVNVTVINTEQLQLLQVALIEAGASPSGK